MCRNLWERVQALVENTEQSEKCLDGPSQHLLSPHLEERESCQPRVISLFRSSKALAKHLLQREGNEELMFQISNKQEKYLLRWESFECSCYLTEQQQEQQKPPLSFLQQLANVKLNVSKDIFMMNENAKKQLKGSDSCLSKLQCNVH